MLNSLKKKTKYYRYFDMWQVIDEALKLVNRLKDN